MEPLPVEQYRSGVLALYDLNTVQDQIAIPTNDFERAHLVFLLGSVPAFVGSTATAYLKVVLDEVLLICLCTRSIHPGQCRIEMMPRIWISTGYAPVRPRPLSGHLFPYLEKPSRTHDGCVRLHTPSLLYVFSIV
jgi:hypothetical protein